MVLGKLCCGTASFAAAVASVFLFALWFLLFDMRHDRILGQPEPEKNVHTEAVLDHYEKLAKNMTVRIETAERALLLMRQAIEQKSARRAGTLIAAGASGPAAGKSKPASAPAPAEAEEEPEEEGFNEEQGEGDEMSEQEMAREVEEQNKLIQYDASTRKFRRWRGDFRCGSRVPSLPDGEVVECDPLSPAPCCSNLGWCGRSKEHCACETCLDFRKENNVRWQTLRLNRGAPECPGGGINLGSQLSAEACAKIAVPRWDCLPTIMVPVKQMEWGCRCCKFTTKDGGPSKGPPADPSKWNVYEVDGLTVAPPTDAAPR